MTHKENITAILECNFAGFKKEIIDTACNRILEQESKWIPVNKRLPKEDTTVIASTKDEVFPEAKYTKYGWQWAYESGADYWVKIEDTVVAWMPLPETYKESEDKR